MAIRSGYNGMRASAPAAPRVQRAAVAAPDSVPETRGSKPVSPGARFAVTYFNADGDSVEITDRAMNLFRSRISQGGESETRPAPEQSAAVMLFKTVAAHGNNPPENAAPVPGMFESIQMSPETAPVKPPGECKTCANRRYIDRSDDPSVSYQTPTKINPNMAVAAVSSHEQEHVRNERSAADRNDRDIVNQTVTLTYDCCPECGRHYVSGGTTRTTSVGRSESGAGMENGPPDNDGPVMQTADD